MGKLETEARYERKKGYVQSAVLSAIGIAGLLALTALAPNTLQLLSYGNRNKYRFANQARTVAGRLARKGYIRFVRRDGKNYVELTEAGARVLDFEKRKAELSNKRKRKWDKRWRMVVFDIPERRKRIRERLRATMRECGFLRLQDSVWVFPYDCEEFIVLLKAELETGKDILYAIVEKIENDGPIKKHFGL